MAVSTALLRRFEDLSRHDVDYAGGKGANLGVGASSSRLIAAAERRLLLDATRKDPWSP